MNIMAMNVLAANTGIEISFLDWTAICMPIALVLLAACWLSVTLVFRPEPISAATMACIEEKRPAAVEALTEALGTWASPRRGSPTDGLGTPRLKPFFCADVHAAQHIGAGVVEYRAAQAARSQHGRREGAGAAS